MFKLLRYVEWDQVMVIREALLDEPMQVVF